jgi:hypothetical protein
MYECQLQSWRIAELEAGRDDPGRPSYEAVSGYLNCFLAMTYYYFRYSAARESRSTATMLHITMRDLQGTGTTAIMIVHTSTLLVRVSTTLAINSLSLTLSFLYHSPSSIAFLACLHCYCPVLISSSLS